MATPTPTSEPIPTPMPTDTSTPRLTVTSAPTPTVESTPAYTQPVETETPQPCPTEEETAYFDKITEIEIDLAQSFLDKKEEQSILAGANPELLLDIAWLGRVASMTFDLNYHARRIRGIEPVPESVRDIHLQMLVVADLADEFANLFMEGVDLLDNEKILGAELLIENIRARGALLSLEAGRFCE